MSETFTAAVVREMIGTIRGLYEPCQECAFTQGAHERTIGMLDAFAQRIEQDATPLTVSAFDDQPLIFQRQGSAQPNHYWVRFPDSTVEKLREEGRREERARMAEQQSDLTLRADAFATVAGKFATDEHQRELGRREVLREIAALKDMPNSGLDQGCLIDGQHCAFCAQNAADGPHASDCLWLRAQEAVKP